MKDLVLLVRIGSFIAIILGAIVSLFKFSTGFIVVLLGIVVWNLTSKYLDKLNNNKEFEEKLKKAKEALDAQDERIKKGCEAFGVHFNSRHNLSEYDFDTDRLETLKYERYQADLLRREKSVDLATFQRDLEIINDCAKLIESTVNPDTFFSRYKLYIKKLSFLAEAQASKKIHVTGDDLVQKYERMTSEKQKIETINAFIDRMWSNTRQKAETLKTEKGKENRFRHFIDTLAAYDGEMPEQCIEHYLALFSTASRAQAKSRHQIAPEKIDASQRMEASASYKNLIYRKFYADYPEKPFISKDREDNTNWLEQAEMFKGQSIIPCSVMTRFPDGLLPGHVYMLYWIDKIHRKRIPVYFEYEFGVDFEKERRFLQKEGYLDDNSRLTEKGRQAMINHYDIIENKKR